MLKYQLIFKVSNNLILSTKTYELAAINFLNIYLIIDPPKTFDPEMSDDDFLLFLNMYGIPYEVCCTLLIGKKYVIMMSYCITIKNCIICLVCVYMYMANDFLIIVALFPLYTIDNDITAQRFNLSTFEYWSQQLEIRDMEKADLRQLIGTSLQ